MTNIENQKVYGTPIKEAKKVIETPAISHINKTMEKSHSIKCKLTDYNEPIEMHLNKDNQKKVLQVSESQNISILKQAMFKTGITTSLGSC